MPICISVWFLTWCLLWSKSSVLSDNALLIAPFGDELASHQAKVLGVAAKNTVFEEKHVRQLTELYSKSTESKSNINKHTTDDKSSFQLSLLTLLSQTPSVAQTGSAQS